MPFEHPLAAEGTSDSLRHVESCHAPPDSISANVHAQLTNPQDIASANQFFKPTGANQFLPTVGNVGPNGIEMTAVTPGPKFAAPPMTGLETQGLHLPAGGEMSALSAAPGAALPGAEPLSPLINMIMKMPGHIGLASSFFEALGAFFAPAQEMLGHLVEGFDPSALFEHAGSASEALGGAMESVGDHLSVDLNLLPGDAPIFDQIGHSAASGDLVSGTLDFKGQGLEGGSSRLLDSFASAPNLEVGGGPSHPMFELGPDSPHLSFDGPNGNYLAMEPNHGFGATVGNFSPPAATAPQPMPAPTATPSAPTAHTSSALDFRKEAISASREHLLGNTTGGASHGADGHNLGASHTADQHVAAQAAHSGGHAGDGSVADAADHAGSSAGDQAGDHTAAHSAAHAGDRAGDKIAETHNPSSGENVSYKVHQGDNLWDIARTHLGDGTRWEEIYDLNKSVLGDNPRMIMPGTELQMPGGDMVADGSAVGSDYTVQSGDNLWNISQEHLGGGQNWHELYQNNDAIVGSNPSMIHPGQHLHLDASAHGPALNAGGDAGTNHTLASGGSHGHHLANHPQGPVHTHNVATAAAPHDVAQAAAPHHVAQAAAPHHVAQSTHGNNSSPAGELKAQAQSISSIQSYGDVSSHTVDSASQVPNSQP